MVAKTVRRYSHKGHTIFEGSDGKYRCQAGISRSSYTTLEGAKKAIDRYISKHNLKR